MLFVLTWFCVSCWCMVVSCKQREAFLDTLSVRKGKWTLQEEAYTSRLIRVLPTGGQRCKHLLLLGSHTVLLITGLWARHAWCG